MNATYTISDDGKSITCHKCGETSHNPNDVLHHYCGHCNYWHDIGSEPHVEYETKIIPLVHAFTVKLTRQFPGVRVAVLAFRPPDEPHSGKIMGLTMATNAERDMLQKVFGDLADPIKKDQIGPNTEWKV